MPAEPCSPHAHCPHFYDSESEKPCCLCHLTPEQIPAPKDSEED